MQTRGECDSKRSVDTTKRTLLCRNVKRSSRRDHDWITKQRNSVWKALKVAAKPKDVQRGQPVCSKSFVGLL